MLAQPQNSAHAAPSSVESSSPTNKPKSLFGKDRTMELVSYRWRSDGWYGIVPQRGPTTPETIRSGKSWNVSSITLAAGLHLFRGFIMILTTICIRLVGGSTDALFVHARIPWAGASWPRPFLSIPKTIPSRRQLFLRLHRCSII
jgi:hypothetical protein